MKEKIKKDLNNRRPIKRMGQNFLFDNNILDKIISVSDLSPNEDVLEIGPGTGFLTERLINKKVNIVSVEKDYNLFEILKEKFKDCNNLKIINEDILKFNLDNMEREYKVVANIPYYLTSPVIRKFLESKKQPKTMILTIQKEVAKRICSSPPNMNILSLSVQYYADVKIMGKVSKNSFWPVPKVDSAIIKITPFRSFSEDSILLFALIKAGFSSPRKKLITNISRELKIEKEKVLDIFLKNNYNGDIRAEELLIDDWIKLKDYFKNGFIQ